jgi:hypothetical protein
VGDGALTPAGLLTQATTGDESLDRDGMAVHGDDALDLGEPESRAAAGGVVEHLEPGHLVLGTVEPDLRDMVGVEGNHHPLHARAEDGPRGQTSSAEQIAGVLAGDASHGGGP